MAYLNRNAALACQDCSTLGLVSGYLLQSAAWHTSPPGRPGQWSHLYCNQPPCRSAAGIQIHLGARAHGVAPAAPLPLPAALSPPVPPAARWRPAAPAAAVLAPAAALLPLLGERAAAAALAWPALALPPQAFRAAMMSSRRHGVVLLVLAHDRFLRRFFLRALVCEKLVCEKQRKRIRKTS